MQWWDSTFATEIKKSIILTTEVFDTITRTFTRTDNRMKKWHINADALGTVITAVLGITSSVVALIAGFEEKTVAMSFGYAASL
jgi:hypothetical protein